MASSMFTIANGCNVPLNQQTGSIPDMGAAMLDWFQLLTFSQVVKTVVDFQVVETINPIAFWGLVMPMKARALELLPIGQRAWTWLSVYAQTAPNGSLLTLNVDDVGVFNGIQTRVMGRKDYALYSFCQYSWVQDWLGSGPPTP